MASLILTIRQSNSLRANLSVLLRLMTILCIAGMNACAVTQPQINTVIVNDNVVDGATQEVQIVRAGLVLPAARGANLEVGDVVKTGPASQAVLLLEGGAVEVIMMENSEIRISSIFVALGEVFVRVKKKLGSVFEVESDYGVAGVEGTEFIVSVRRGADYSCVTLEGKVKVRSANGGWPARSVPARQEITVNSGSTPQQRTLNQVEYNALVNRVNHVERIYRPNSMQLLVPDVSGLMEADARRLLQSQNLTVGAVSGRITSRAKVGEVLAQNPAAGQRIKPRSSIQLEVEAQPTNVPNVTGNSLEAAVRALNGARLKQGNINTQITGNNKAGVVFRQQPGAGQRVPVDSLVDLWVEAESRKVPQVVNLNIEKAKQMLIANQLQVGKIDERLVEGTASGTVLEQGIAANELVVPDSRINLVVAERGVRVPNLINNSSAGASRLLSSAGLKLGSAPTQPSRNKTGSVFEQSPAPGTLVKPGSQVNIVLAGQCRVPNVIGMTSSAANAAISRADLLPRVRKTGNNDITKVYGQGPAANSNVNCGSVVYLDMGNYVVQ